tara:strand:+ start:313 stop:579 length:267 start_codon:yes stop_codon:yes gene_type:complete
VLATPSTVSGVVSSSKGLTRPSISKKKTELFRENLKMSYMKTQMKSDLWDIVYKAQADGVGREVTNAIIDVMILMDKEAEKKELSATE